jgi:hypothetical protein
MAAVLCSGIGGLCEGCGKLLCLPFRACNCICHETCKGCATICTTLSGCCSSPFFPYFAITLLLNSPGIIYAIVAVVNTVVKCNDNGDNDGDGADSNSLLLRWLIVNAVIALCHMVAAAYIVTQIRTLQVNRGAPSSSPSTPTIPGIPVTTGTEIPKNDNVESGHTPPPPAQQSTPPPPPPPRLGGMDQVYNILKIPSRDVQGSPDSCDRVKFVLCFDPVVALYLIAFVFWIVWLAFGMGRAWSYDGGGGDENDDPCHKADLERYTNLSVMCGFLYVFLVGIAFSISLCCLIR